MTEWHRLFGLVLTDYFSGSSYSVELEKDLSLKRQFVDVIIIERESGKKPSELPDGLEGLGPHNIMSYKSFQEPFSAWACDELLGHYVNYRKQVSPAMDSLLPESDFCLYGVSTRFPKKLAQCVKLQPVTSGVYDLDWGSRRIRLLVLSQIQETKRNAIWQLFSANPEHVQYGASHYQWHSRELSTVLYELYKHYCLEGINMPYTVNDFYRDFTRSHLDWLSAQERLEGISPEERLKNLSPEERLKNLSPEERLKNLSPEERLKNLSPEERLKNLSPEERLKNLSLEERLKDLSPEDILDTLLSGGLLEQISPEKREQFIQHLHRRHEPS